MINNDTKFGYEKILGLRGDRTKKRSLEARADAFSRLKNDFSCFDFLGTIIFCATHPGPPQQPLFQFLSSFGFMLFSGEFRLKLYIS